jgi:DNA mismatch repair protein MutS2
VGEVLELRSDGRLVIKVGSMRMVIDRKGAVGLGAEPARRSAPSVSGDQPVREAAFEIDLRGMTGDEAEMATLAAVDAGVLAEHPYLRIIHGIGTGVVRERVRRVLSSDRRVAKYEYAPRSQGGNGVTVAEFAP